VPTEHSVRLASSEFTNFALFWWSDLCNTNNAAAVPQTWNALKQRMKSRFVPPYYQRDLRLKLQTLKQGDKKCRSILSRIAYWFSTLWCT